MIFDEFLQPSKEQIWYDKANSLKNISNCYTGNKKNLLFHISQFLDKNNIEFKTVFDVFSGSGTVSFYFKLLNKNVISNDILTSSYYNVKALAENNNEILDEKLLKFLIENKPINQKSWVFDNYIDKFTEEESKFLDNYRSNIDLLENDYQKALAFVCIQNYIIDNCFVGGRLNKGQVLAELSHRLSHPRNKGSKMLFNLTKLAPISTFDGQFIKSLNKDVLNAFFDIKSFFIKPELIYLDPPYGGEQSDYGFMYKFFEEFVYQKPISDLEHLQNSKKFVKAKTYEQNFRDILEQSKEYPYILISYNDSSWKDINYIKNIVSDFKTNIVIEEIDWSYKYRKTSSAKEFLILAK